MPLLSEQSERTDRPAAVSWLKAKLHLAEVEPSATPQPVSWQEVHRQDTSRLARWHDSKHGMRVQERTGSTASETPLGTAGLGWVRRNAALIYLLRTGQWQPVPSLPPDRWVERLVMNFLWGNAGCRPQNIDHGVRGRS
jgi:hypothetical protein